jgi:gliding motility-associated-like protein
MPDYNGPDNDPPFAGDDFAFTPKNEPVSGNLLPNDFDPNGDNIVLNTNPITQPANGTVVILPNGTFTYTPITDYVGPDQFIYSICDDGTPSLCAEATAYITVYQYNNPPVAVDDINGTLVDVPVSGNVLTNDLDPDGDNLTVTTTPVTPPTNGTVTLNPDGSYTYTPTTGFTGTDTFVYSVCDDGVPQLCDQATVTITVTEPTISNDPPVANPDFYVTLVNVPVPGNILTNDSDPDGDNIVLNTTPVSAPSNGSVTVNANGNIIYTPNLGFTGTDVFTYSICDDGTPSLCDQTTVTVVVMPDYNGPDNDPPFAGDDFAFTPENEPVSGNLLPNDFDPNGDNIILNVTPLSGPTNGTVAISPDGSFTYTPNTDYTGPDQFIYRICDDGVPSLCAEATAYITVYPANNPPVAVDDINNTLVDVPVNGNVITNDYDIDGNSLTVTTVPVTPPVNGTVTLNANGTYTYTPNAGYTGEDTFTYQLCDDGNPVLCDQALVTITIVELTLDNDPPVANPDFYVTLMNVPVPGNITMNDADPDGDDIILNTTPLTLPANGTVTVNANGNIIYTPNTGFTGTDVFTYRICDDGVPSLCDETTVTIVVVPDYNGPDNDPPFAGDDAAFTPVNVPVSGNHFVNDFDPNGDNIVINTTPLSGPTNGTVVIQANGTYTYTPNTDYVGPDQFVYRICDDGTPSLCAEATAYITVYDGPFLTWTITEPLCNGQSTGAINLTVNNATPPYTFIWSNSATTEDISGLPAGTYGVIVQDALGSVVQASIPLTQPAVLGVTTSVQDETTINGCNGTATANPTGGTAPYTYLWTPSGQTTQQATGLCAGIVQVTVTDVNGCQVTTSNVINPPSCDLDVLVSGTNVSCNGGTNGTALATPITVQNNTPFTYLWSNGATTQSISGVISGPYSVTVTDAIGCQAAGTYVVTQPLALSLTTSTVDEQSFGACDGSATVTPSGGTGVYTYSWTGGQTTQTATALCPGTYTVTVTDGNGCIAQRTVTINALSCTGFAVAINGTNLTCFGTNNGAATAVVTNGTAPFTYLWNTGATTSSISGLSAGTYTVTVTDAVNCSQTVDRVITRPALLQAATAVDNVTCFGFNNGAIELTVTGGTTPYTFAWSNGAVVEDLVALGPNTYNVTVTDANGCQVNSSGTVTEPAQLVATSVNTNVTCFGGSDGAINLTVTGGLAPYLYSWTGGPATEDRTGLAIGTYSVSIVDQNGCILPFSTTITQAPQFTPTVTASGPTTFCQGGNVVLTATAGASYLWSNGATTQAITVSTTGTYTVTVTTAQGCVGTSAPTSVLVNPLPTPTATAIGPTTFCQGGSVQLTTGSFASYLWSTGATTQSITVSTAGSYTVTVTNANGCVGTSAPINVTVNPLPTPTITAGGPTTFCNGGSVQLTSSAASSYLWSTGATTQSITVSTAGNYTVTVTNANGCVGTSAPITVTLNALPTPSVSANGPTTFCQGGGVLLTSSAASSYLWSNGQISQSIFVTVAGSYTVEVTDGNGCKATSAPVNVTVNPNPTPTVTPNGPTTFCAGGSVVLTSSPAASYLWNNGAITQSITVTTTGFYSVTVTNASGCTGASAPVQVIVNTPPTATITPIGPTTFCQGGSVQLVASAGASYLWSNGATTQSITVSTTGSYSVQVFAASGCSTNSAPVNVTVNPLPTATITASGPTTICQGSTVTLTASTGVSYLWSNGATSQSITVGTAGSYTVTVTNANGCSRTSAPTSVLINSLPVPTITASGPLSFCPGGSVTLTASLSASYLWSNGATTRAITVTTAGSYSVQVTDDNGCTASAGPVNVTVNPTPTPTISSSGPTTFCQGGSVVLTASPAASYLWSTGATTASITVSAAGSYFVTVTNAQGCSGASTPISVVVNPNPTPTITAGGPTTFCQGGSVVLTASPAAGYLWSTGAVSQSITVSTSGSYSVTVTNVNGCPGTSAPVVVNVNTLPTPTVTANGPTTFCQGGSVTLTSSAAASYLWSTGATTQSITVSTANTYNVTVTDANGCSNTSALVTISVLPNPTPTITAGGPTTFCQGGNVVLTASPAVGYLWSTGATTQSITVSASGSYTVTVTDGNGCSGTSVPTTVTVNPLPTPTVTASGPTTFCQGGSVTLTASAGIAYLWSNGAITQSIVVSTTGFYSVTVTNVNGCAATSAPVPVNANPNPIPVVTAGGPTTFCQGGSVTLTSSFGLNYLWSTGATSQSITVSTNGNYTVTVTDGNGCTGTSLPVAVNINLLPQPVVDLDGPASFCQGDNVELTVSAGTAYLWNTGATTQSITVSTAGDYFATVTDINGCSGNSDTVSVTVFSLPTPSITADGPTTFCAGEDVVLTSSVASSYLWNTGATTQSITVSASGIFSVTVTDANGCSAAATPVVVTVTDGPTPNILPNGATTFCEGGSVLLTTRPADSYLWSNGATTQNIVVTTSGAYSVTVTDENGCSGTSAVVNVTVNPNPAPTIGLSGPATFCEGDDVVLAIVSPGTVLWSTGDVGPLLTVDNTGSYWATLTDANGCSGNSDTVQVTVLPNPTPIIVTDGTPSFCVGEPVNLTTGVYASYLWSNGATTQGISLMTSGNFTVTVTDANGCVGTSPQVVVGINPNPTPTISPDGQVEICAGETVTLTSAPAITYLWSTGETTQSIVVSTAGIYNVFAEDINGCTAISSDVIVVVNPLPTPTIVAGGPLDFCDGGSVLLSTQVYASYEWSTGSVASTITATGSGNYTVTVTDVNGCEGTSPAVTVTEFPVPVVTVTPSGPTDLCAGGSVELTANAASSYLWSTGETTQSIIVNTAGSYSVTITDANGCTATSAPVNVTIQQLPTPTVFPFGPQQICAGGSVTLTSTTAASYLWSTGETTQSIVVTTAGVYTLNVEDLNGCTSADVDIPVTVNPLPTPVIVANGPTEFCEGGSVLLSTSQPYDGYVWSTGTVNSNVVASNSGIFTVTVTDANGCVGTSAPLVVTEYPAPVVTISTSGPTDICAGGSVELTATAAVSYLWSTGETTQSITVDAAGSYTVTVTDANGCSTTATPVPVTILTLPTPTVFPFGPQQICVGGSVTLTSTTASSYLWSTGETTQSIEVTSGGIVSLTVQDLNGCTSATVDIPVTVNPLPVPVVVANGPTEFCDGGSVVLSTTVPFSGYVWSTGTVNSTITVGTSGTYSVTVTDANGCQGTSAGIAVTEYPVNPVTITSSGTPAICSGDSVELTASAAASYLWSTGATTPTIWVNASGNYTVVATDINGCTTTSAPMNVTILTNPTPTLFPFGPQFICDGQSITLTSTTAASYLWSTGATTQSIVVNTAGNYSVTVTDVNGCEGTTGTVPVTVNPLPVPTVIANGALEFCQGGNVLLSTQNFAGYQWSSGAAQQSTFVTQPGNYTVTVIDANGCVGVSAPINVTVNQPPTVTITADGPVELCQGGMVTLTATAGQNYSWSTGAVTQSITVFTSGTYIVSVTDANGCVGTSAPVTISVYPLPDPNIIASGPTEFCQGDSVQLTSSPAATYLWNTGDTTQSIWVTQGGNYYVTLANGFGCEAFSSSINITINSGPVPVIAAGGPLQFCDGGQVTLTANGAQTYLWSTGQTTPSITVIESGTFTVTGYDANGCSGESAPIDVVEFDIPVVTITASGPTTVCAGETVTLTATGATSYLWSTGETTQSIVVATAGTYTVSVVDANGCPGASAGTTVFVNALPVPVIAADGPLAFCQGDSVVLSVSGYQGYLWSTGSTNSDITVYDAGQYFVTVVDNNGCAGTSAIVNVGINPDPVVTITSSTNSFEICEGSSVVLTASAGDTYIWSTGSVSQSIQVTEGGTYTVTVTNQFGCEGEASKDVIIRPRPTPTPEIIADGATTFCDGDSVVLSVVDSYDGYLWSTGATTQSIVVNTTGLYTVNVFNEFGCTATANGVVVTVNPNPVPVIFNTGGTTLCAGDSIVLATTTVYNGYLWNTGETTEFIVVDTTGNYNVTVTNSFGCVGTSADLTITVINLPEVEIVANGPTSLCPGQSVELSAIGNGPFVWSTGEITNTITVFLSGDYFVSTVDTNTGCANVSDTVTIDVFPVFIPEITVDGPTAFCGDGEVTLTVVNGATFEWTTGETTQSITVDSTGVYGVLVTDANGCQGVAAETVTVFPEPIAIIVPDLDVPYCDGETITLTVTPELGGSYLWNTGETSNSIQVTQSGLYSVVVTNIFGCSSEGFLPVGFVPTPTVSVSVEGQSVICEGDVTELSASFTLGGSYVWSNGATGQNITVDEAGSYTVTVTNLAGCSATSDAVVIEVVPVVRPDAGVDIYICLGQEATLIATGGEDYFWTPSGVANDSLVVSPEVSTLYVVTATGNNCAQSASDSVWVFVTAQPVAAFENTEANQGTSITFTDLSTPQDAINAWSWSFGDGQVSLAQNPEYTYEDEGTYTVTLVVSAGNGCSDSVSVELEIDEFFTIPDVLTPNNDGFNDFAWITSSSADVINASIYNRWGVSVWEGVGKDLRFYGRTTAGAELPAGTYYYVINVNYGDGVIKDYTGYMTLIRD